MILIMTGKDTRNWTKIKCFDYMQRIKGQFEYTTPNELAWHTGTNRYSLYVLLRRWIAWGYVEQQVKAGTDPVKYEYRLAAKGRAYLKSAAKWYQYYSEAIAENDYRQITRYGIFDGKNCHVFSRDGRYYRYHIFDNAALYSSMNVCRLINEPVTLFDKLENEFHFHGDTYIRLKNDVVKAMAANK